MSVVKKKTNAEKQSVGNLRSAMEIIRGSPIFTNVFTFDEMLVAVILNGPLPTRGTDDLGNDGDLPRPIRDTDVSKVQEWLQRQGLSRISKNTTHDAVVLRATECAFHPVRDWLNSLK